ncbi:MAG: amylosucrase [Leptolyngbyaceae bacterium]|nr:amylosucrase [Leptolyngbyaceae bacterium]
MGEPIFFSKEIQTSLSRLMPRLEARFANQVDQGDWHSYVQRINTHFPRLFKLLFQLYGQQYDFFYHLEDIMATATQMWVERPDDLKGLDVMREADPHWYQANRMVGAMCYVDLFAGDLQGIRDRIPYLTEMGITYLHLMPVFKSPEGDNDGGYAVSSYREIDPPLGTMEQLKELASELRRHGISLVVDFIFNHTSDEHDWAAKALAGYEDYQEYYRMYNSRDLPDAFEQSIVAVFPDEHPGCFTYRNRIRKWVWTTFHNYQWDLNYENPTVFSRMVGEMLFLANVGVEILRLDAVAFLWKRIGTRCENLPEAHLIIQAFNALIQIAAPALVFKSEAIVHPDEVNKYIGKDECQLSYNPQLMALLWNALATREVSLLRHAMEKRLAIPSGCAWVNYIRCHDDIGWAFSDEDAAEIHLNFHDHRKFLTSFYTGQFPGSFGRGQPFQENPNTGEARVSGTTASLCGLEKGLYENNTEEVELAVRRVLLLHGILMTIGGIPLIYLGDELGMLNDYDYSNDPDKEGDSRWLHRLKFDWKRAEQRSDRETIPGQIYQGLLKLIQIRQQNRAFTNGETDIMDTGNDHVFGYFRHDWNQNVLVLANFTEHPQEVVAKRLRLLGLRKTFTDIVSGRTITAMQKLVLDPYQLMILLGIR